MRIDTFLLNRELEELEALRQAEEKALVQAEVAAKEAAIGLNIFDDDNDLDDVSLHSDTDGEKQFTTPSTRSLSVDDKKSPEEPEFRSRDSFKDPTQPLSASIRPPSDFKRRNSIDGMTNSALQRHVSTIFVRRFFFKQLI